MDTCDKCGVEVKVGSWPFCPHDDVKRFGEEPMTPTVFEHLGDMEFRTRGELRRYMDKNGIEPANVSHAKPKLYFT